MIFKFIYWYWVFQITNFCQWMFIFSYTNISKNKFEAFATSVSSLVFLLSFNKWILILFIPLSERRGFTVLQSTLLSVILFKSRLLKYIFFSFFSILEIPILQLVFFHYCFSHSFGHIWCMICSCLLRECLLNWYMSL